MSSKEFEKYLNQSTTEQDKQAFAQIKLDRQQVTEIPVTNSHTPNPVDAGKPIAGVEDTGKADALAKYQLRQSEEVKSAGQTLQQGGVTPADGKDQNQGR